MYPTYFQQLISPDQFPTIQLNGKNINPYSLASKILINKDLKIINDICKS